jgi:porin
VNIPSGGPAYPVSTPGIRLKVDPTPQTTALLAVFNGDPAGPCGADSERCNRHGLNFRVNDPPFVVGELQYRYNQEANSAGLAGGIRFGGWHHLGRFDDLRFDINGFSLASPLSSGMARRLRGNDGVYAVIDQQLYRPPRGDANSGILLFGRAAYSSPDRGLNDFYLDGGIICAGMIAARPADAFGASFLYAHISKQARGLDIDTRVFTGLPVPLRDYELSLELTYGASIVPGWIVQPNVQLIFHPGGNIPGATSPVEPIRNAVVVGVRSTMRY